MGEQIAERASVIERAYARWIERGSRKGSGEANWMEAERKLHDTLVSRRLLADAKGASVQRKVFRLQLLPCRRNVCP